MTGQTGNRETGRDRGTGGGFPGVCLWGLVLALACLPYATAAAKYAGGSGTTNAPFLIETAEDFQAIADNPADWDKCFKLTKDIDLSGYNEANLHMIGRWVMWGSMDNQPFRGVFDGDGKAIANFTYRNMSDDFIGLFQFAAGTIKNLRLVRPKVTGNKAGTGALVGYLQSGLIAGCSATKVSVSGNLRVGGLVGQSNGGLNSSCSDGVVAGVSYVGGLIGQAGEGSVQRSCSKAQVIGQESVGGLIGVTVHEDSIVSSCYATGAVRGKTYVGGLVGQLSPGRVGWSYSAGKVTGEQAVGGLVGLQRALGDVISSVWDIETSTQATSVGGTGKTTAEMKSAATFQSLGWDFPNVWSICEGTGYPILTWEIPPGDWFCPDGVDFQDFAWFASNWRRQDCGVINYDCDGADLDLSGAVDFSDLIVFAENWLAGM
jgi:hypothetical protein